jgi:hypothetical protein
MPFLWIGQTERETLMNDKPAISPRAKAQQLINDELRKKGKDVPGAQEIGELIQDDLDAHLLEFKQVNAMEGDDEAKLQWWIDFMGYINGRPISQDAARTLTVLAEQYSVHEIAAIVDDIRILGITLDVVAEEPNLQINWRVIGT